MTSTNPDLLVFSPKGIYCPPADVYIDPWKPVSRALITHAHSDHARSGHGEYVCTPLTAAVLKHRLGKKIRISELPFGQKLNVDGVQFSFHPAGHIPGSAQVRVAYRGEIWVVTGDYKLEPDPISEPFESVRCHTLITESTFGLPVYQWARSESVIAEIHQWWRDCQDEGRLAVLAAYSLGKAQRLLSELDPGQGPLFTHETIEPVNALFRAAGLALPSTTTVNASHQQTDLKGALLIAPPAVLNSDWLQRMGPVSDAIASGWMALRGTRRQRTSERGFALSDHADWPGLLNAVRESGAQRVLVTHGFAAPFARYLREIGLDARDVETRFRGEPQPEDTTNTVDQINPV